MIRMAWLWFKRLWSDQGKNQAPSDLGRIEKSASETDNLQIAMDAVSSTEDSDAGTLVPCDEQLLDRCRMQWQIGDWASLSKLQRDDLQHHPERAKLALLAAAGRAQTEDINGSASYLRLALDWGASRQLANQIMVAGVYNNLGCAAALGGRGEMMHRLFVQSVSTGAALKPDDLLVQVRMKQQLAQITVPGLELSLQAETKPPVFRSPQAASESLRPSESVRHAMTAAADALRLHDTQAAFSHAQTALGHWLDAERAVQFATTPLDTAAGKTVFLHVEGDYIPQKIRNEKRFYEPEFLELLSGLHQTGGTFVDVGANIGNHSIYFAKVVGAPVIAIEPAPDNHVCLAVNAALNAPNVSVQCLSVAVGDTQGHVELEMGVGGNYGSFTFNATLNPEFKSDQKRHVCRVVQTTLDDALLPMFGEGAVPSIVKIDVEGMEIQVIRGAQTLLETYRPVVAVECFTHAFFLDVERELSRLDYFPLETLNATPTFTFVNRRNSRHLSVLEMRLRQNCIKQARRNKNYV